MQCTNNIQIVYIGKSALLHNVVLCSHLKLASLCDVFHTLEWFVFLEQKTPNH